MIWASISAALDAESRLMEQAPPCCAPQHDRQCRPRAKASGYGLSAAIAAVSSGMNGAGALNLPAADDLTLHQGAPPKDLPMPSLSHARHIRQVINSRRWRKMRGNRPNPCDMLILHGTACRIQGGFGHGVCLRSKPAMQGRGAQNMFALDFRRAIAQRNATRTPAHNVRGTPRSIDPP